MGYVVGAAFTGAGIAMFRKGGVSLRTGGCIAALVGIVLIGLSIMVEAKRHGVI